MCVVQTAVFNTRVHTDTYIHTHTRTTRPRGYKGILRQTIRQQLGIRNCDGDDERNVCYKHGSTLGGPDKELLLGNSTFFISPRWLTAFRKMTISFVVSSKVRIKFYYWISCIIVLQANCYVVDCERAPCGCDDGSLLMCEIVCHSCPISKFIAIDILPFIF